MQHSSLAAQQHPLASVTPRSLLSFFLRPAVTRALNSHLSIEIENLRQAPSLCYIRFYDRNGQISLPPNLICVDLLNSALVRRTKDSANRPAFLVVDISWHAICQGQTVLAYVHASGSIFLPTEVTALEEITDVSFMMTPEGRETWGYMLGMIPED